MKYILDNFFANALIISFGLILSTFFGLLWFWQPVAFTQYIFHENNLWIRAAETVAAVAILVYGIVRTVWFFKSLKNG